MGAAIMTAAKGVALWFSANKVAATVIKTVLTLAATTAISKALTPRLRMPMPKQDVEYSGTVETRRIIYGEMLVSGMNVIPPLVSGTNNEFLHQALALSGHELNSIGQIYFNRTAIGTITAITGSDDDGKITSGAWNNKAWVRAYRGTNEQTADYKLNTAFTEWTSGHRGREVGYIALTYQFDETVYKTGKPEVTALVEGKRVYDPRLDSTQPGGVGSQRLDDPSTFTYSSNPALCLADYLISTRLGLGEDTDRIDWVLVADAADICDELVNIPGPATQKRYTCNVILSATDRFEDNISKLADAMSGVCYYSGGLWRMFAGAWQSSSFTLDESDLVDNGLSVTTAFAYNERYNSVRGKFINGDKNWQEMEFQPVINTSYVSADGEQAWLDVDFAACTNEYEAQRHAILLSRRSRNGTVATIRAGMSAYKIRPFDVGQITIAELGWTNKYVRCESWQFNPAGFVELVVREEDSSDWSDPVVGDYETPTSVSTPVPSTYIPAPPSGLTAKNLASGFNLSWTAPAVLPTGSVYEVYEHTSITPFSSAVRIWSGVATSVFIPKNDTTTRYYWVRVRTDAGNTSTTEPATNGVAAAADSLPGSLTATVAPSSVSKTDTGTSITTASVTVTAAGGTPGYTYSWVRTSGSTSIAADSASSATTTFTGSSLASGSTYSAVFTCTVTDAVAATKTAIVSVEITRIAMTASASPSTLSKTGTAATLTTASTTVTPSGGTAPYTYAWTFVSGDSFTITSASAATTTFSATLNEDEFVSGIYRCTVTDSTGGTPLTATADVPVTITRLGGGGVPP
jgi:hypothetical protein